MLKWHELSAGIRYNKLTFINIENTKTRDKRGIWRCDCGKEKSILISHVLRGNSKSCGMCSMILIDITQKFGSLRIKESTWIQPKTNKKTIWVCDCGKNSLISIYHIVRGAIKTCGRCNTRPISYWDDTKFGTLKMLYPSDDYHPKSNKKVDWVCDCGQIIRRSISQIVTNSELHKRITCGLCNQIIMRNNEKIGALTYTGITLKIHPTSRKKLTFRCDCGRDIIKSIINARSSQSCAKCNILCESYWSSHKFGKLKMKDPINSTIGSGKIVEWVCDCGNITKKPINVVTRKQNGTKTCGKCSRKASTWYLSNKEHLKNLTYPIAPELIPHGLFTITNPIQSSRQKLEAVCDIYNQKYKPRWDNIKRGTSLTCGCTSYHVSQAQIDIQSYILSLGIDCDVEYKLFGYKYDLCVPSENLLIEFNGLRWHSIIGSKERDFRKYNLATHAGYSYLMIFEDEWLFRNDILKYIISNKLKKTKSKIIKHNNISIKSINMNIANQFYDKFHYIGSCNSIINYGVFHDNELVCCISFSHPTRKSKYQFELLRMCSNPSYKIHGIWSKLIKRFIIDKKPRSIVSFSDNRLFSGDTYEKLGFKLDGLVRQNYYWIKGNKRYNKSSLRKTKIEKISNKTETELRESQGYRKIWDLGKKRWIINVASFGV